jgi:hypothetical protein
MTQIQEAQQALLVDLQLCEEKEDDLLDRIHGPLNRQNLLFPLLVLQRAIARIRADLTWVDNTLEQLQRMQT